MADRLPERVHTDCDHSQQFVQAGSLEDNPP